MSTNFPSMDAVLDPNAASLDYQAIAQGGVESLPNSPTITTTQTKLYPDVNTQQEFPSIQVPNPIGQQPIVQAVQQPTQQTPQPIVQKVSIVGAGSNPNPQISSPNPLQPKKDPKKLDHWNDPKKKSGQQPSILQNILFGVNDPEPEIQSPNPSQSPPPSPVQSSPQNTNSPQENVLSSQMSTTTDTSTSSTTDSPTSPVAKNPSGGLTFFLSNSSRASYVKNLFQSVGVGQGEFKKSKSPSFEKSTDREFRFPSKQTIFQKMMAKWNFKNLDSKDKSSQDMTSVQNVKQALKTITSMEYLQDLEDEQLAYLLVLFYPTKEELSTIIKSLFPWFTSSGSQLNLALDCLTVDLPKNLGIGPVSSWLSDIGKDGTIRIFENGTFTHGLFSLDQILREYGCTIIHDEILNHLSDTRFLNFSSKVETFLDDLENEQKTATGLWKQFYSQAGEKKDELDPEDLNSENKWTRGQYLQEYVPDMFHSSCVECDSKKMSHMTTHHGSFSTLHMLETQAVDKWIDETRSRLKTMEALVEDSYKNLKNAIQKIQDPEIADLVEEKASDVLRTANLLVQIQSQTVCTGKGVESSLAHYRENVLLLDLLSGQGLTMEQIHSTLRKNGGLLPFLTNLPKNSFDIISEQIENQME